MKIYKPKKITLWQRINFKLFNISQYLLFNPNFFFKIIVAGLVLFLGLFSWLGYVFYNLAWVHTGYWFGFGLMLLFNYMIIRSFFKLKTFKNSFSGMNVDSMNEMLYGDIMNPIVDKIKGKRND